MPAEYGTAAATPKEKIVWQTSPETFRHNINTQHKMLKDVVLDIVKPGHGEYVGFGEQGGTSFMKKACYMNYFSELWKERKKSSLDLLTDGSQTSITCNTSRSTAKARQMLVSLCKCFS